MFEASFFVGIAFVLLMALIYKPAWRVLRNMLDEKIAKIKKDIHEAASAKELAASLLESAKVQEKEAVKRIQEILDHGDEEFKRLRKQSEQDLEDYKSVEEHLFKERLEQAEREAIHDIEQKAIDVALIAAQKVLKGSVNKHVDQKAVDEAIRLIEKIPA